MIRLTLGFQLLLLVVAILPQDLHATPTLTESNSRIAAGELTNNGEFPATLSLGLSSWANVFHLHFCAGFIITESWTVTAARCLKDAAEDVGRYYWLAGTNNLRQGGRQHTIDQILLHPGYDPTDSFKHNIALAKVTFPFEFSAIIQPIQLSRDPYGTLTAGITGIVVGWGQVTQALIQSDILRRADVTILDSDVCGDVFAPWRLTIYDEFQFCALSTFVDASALGGKERLGRSGQREACRGDEGGPLYLRDTNLPIVVGFVSWTYGCNPSSYPAVYTKLTAYLEWIYESTGYWI